MQEGQTEPQTQKQSSMRTMKSDVEELFKTSKPTLIDLIGQKAEEEGPADSGNQSSQPSRKIRLFLVVGVLFIVGSALAGFLFFKRAEDDRRPIKAVPPAPFFTVETTRSVAMKPVDRSFFLDVVEDSIAEKEKSGTFKHLLIKLQGDKDERFATAEDFFDFYRMNPPRILKDQLRDPLMLFILYSKDAAGFGFAAKVEDAERTLAGMFEWETDMLLDLRPLLFTEKLERSIVEFEDRTYRNIDWRFQKLSQGKDLGIAYAIFPGKDIVLVATSKEMMETAINRLFETK